MTRYLFIPVLFGMDNPWSGALRRPVDSKIIQCVKAYRTASGEGLVDSRDAVERIICDNGAVRDPRDIRHQSAFQMTLFEAGIVTCMLTDDEIVCHQVLQT